MTFVVTGTIFIHHVTHNHTTLMIDNNGLESHSVTTIDDYNDISTDSFKAWALPASGEHWLAGGEHEYKYVSPIYRHFVSSLTPYFGLVFFFVDILRTCSSCSVI